MMTIRKLREQLRMGRSIYDLSLRVTYYARVSTEKVEQQGSLENQVQYYTEFIQKNPNWTFVQGYVDEGISGTSTYKRESFLRMIDDAHRGLFDFIITKEISRFSRSTLDSIQYTQELLDANVGVLFQNDNINTLDTDRESERPVIQTTMNLSVEQVKELQPGECLVVNRRGNIHTEQILPPRNYSACSFERIYFSRGSDVDIYKERKELGRYLTSQILESIDYDLEHTVFSFIPNTAEVAFYGMLEGLNNYLSEQKFYMLRNATAPLNDSELKHILSLKVRSEKVAIKDIKLRTFIAEGDTRDDLAAHVYDITYGTVQADIDNLVIIDDSIVRGTTLKQSIIKILDRLHPKKIIIVSSSPQVRFPDCYGIDMSRMGEFIAFKAAIELLNDRGMQHIIEDVYNKSKAQQNSPKEQITNYVKEIYAPFTQEEISKKIAQMLTSEDITSQVEIIYQTLEGLHQAIPNHPGDWYFSGNYPTPGGNRLVNNAFINFVEGVDNKRQL